MKGAGGFPAAPTDRLPTVLISGAVVLDLLGYYSAEFDRLEWASAPHCVAFNAMPSLQGLVESYGGCAANIAYNLALLGLYPCLVSAAGSDFEASYRPHLERAGVDLSAVRVLPGKSFTPRAVTVTDRSGRQFSFWAANEVKPDHFPSILDLCRQRRPELVIVASNFPATMLEHLQQACLCQVPSLWSPAGDVCYLDRESLQQAWTASHYVVVNDSEWLSVKTIFGGTNPPWPPGLRAVVVTQGARGCKILQRGRRPLSIRAARTHEALDPTGCGDAFVAGFAWGLLHGLDLPACARMGSVLAVFNLESRGTQCHELSLSILRDRIRRDYRRDLNGQVCRGPDATPEEEVG